LRRISFEGRLARKVSVLAHNREYVTLGQTVDGETYIRIAAQIYNDRVDYLKLAEAVLSLR
jgi:hypothetical protein